MNSRTSDISKCYETLKVQALDRNDKYVITWSKYKNDLEVTKSLVSLLSKKVKHSVMVPIGTKALMKGNVVHTNEYLVNLGETWFAKRSAHQTLEICDRRIKSCDEMLKKLEKERELIINKSALPAEQEAFGSEERPEIIEYVSEQENEEWKKQHRIKEKKYRQQLAELRKAEKTQIQTEEDLWKHLDELELQEELEDELNRLNAECSSEEDITDENLKSEDSYCENSTTNEKNNFSDESKKVKNACGKRRVSFACDYNSSDDEPLLLEIKHSDIQPVPMNSSSTEINSPGDIYLHYLNSVRKKPLSVLKNKVDPVEKNNFELFKYNDHNDDDSEEDKDEDYDDEIKGATSVFFKDISERCVSNINETQKIVETKTKKLSKFKLSRKKHS